MSPLVYALGADFAPLWLSAIRGEERKTEWGWRMAEGALGTGEKEDAIGSVSSDCNESDEESEVAPWAGRTRTNKFRFMAKEVANMTGKSRKQQIEEMLADDPHDPFLRYGLAMEHVSAGQDEEAVRCFRDLLQRTPDYVPGYMQAGRALARLNRLEDARALFQSGIAAARKQGDLHAAEEMTGFLDGLD